MDLSINLSCAGRFVSVQTFRTQGEDVVDPLRFFHRCHVALLQAIGQISCPY